MQFKGRLRLPDDTGVGIPVDLRLDDIFLVLVAEGETLGEWRMDDVGVQRVFSNQFLLDLEGEEMVFVADDPLGFAYDGVAEIDATSKRLAKRWRGRKKKRSTQSSAAVVDADRVEAGRAKERRVVAAESTPTVEPSVPVEPAAAAPVAEPPAPIHETAARIAEPPVREPVVLEPVVEAVAAPTEPAAAPEPEPQPPTEPVGAEALEVEPDAVPTVEPEPTPELVFTEPEFEVEEVVVPAATSAFAVVEEQRPELETPPSEATSDDVLHVEPAAPGVAAVAEIAQVPEAEAPPEVDELPEIGSDFPGGSSESAEGVVSQGEVVPGPDAEAVEPAPQSSLRNAAAAARAAIEESASSETDTTDDAALDEAPKHLRERKVGRRSRTRRRRKPDTPEHEHTYDEKSAVGGIIRRVCSQCGHVSFGSEDLYEDWGA